MAKERMLVVGGGVMGLAAAYHLCRAGHPVTLLEQFAPGHARGSSHGPSRIIRYAYDDPRYVELMAHAYALWHALERDTGRQVLWPAGGLDFAPADNQSLRQTSAALAAAGTAHELLGAAELRARFPQFQLPAQTVGIYQADAGILAADQIVRLLADEVSRLGGEIRTQTPATAITAGAGGVVVDTPGGACRADRLVLAAGSWADALLAPLGIALPLRVQHE
ncbi:MAG TPA: FAD-dependent oxidoreductase, partial [Herpetosiphonaceae bacterium]